MFQIGEKVRYVPLTAIRIREEWADRPRAREFLLGIHHVRYSNSMVTHLHFPVGLDIEGGVFMDDDRTFSAMSSNLERIPDVPNRS